jgi:superfamily II DNA or RNA helicase
MNDEIVVSKLNDVFFVLDVNQEQIYELNDFFSCRKKDFKYSPKFKNGIWDGKIRFFNIKNCTLPIGLYKELLQFSKKYRYKIHFDIDKSEMYNEIKDEEIKEFYSEIFKEGIFPRDYQDETIKRCLKFKRGVIESVTSSGKSLSIYSLIRYILGTTEEDKKILLIVPNVSLVNQMVNEFEEYGFKDAMDFISILYSNSKKYDRSKPILVSTWQSIYKKPPIFFKDFVAVIVDECHLASCSSIQKVMQKCTNAEYRLGFTGTLPTDRSELMTINGYLGPKLYTVGYDELIERGILSKMKIANIILRYPDEFVKYNKKRPYFEEINAIISYPKRNDVFKLILEHIDKSENVLILCSQIEHLKSIRKYIEEFLKDSNRDNTIYEIYGKVDPEEREKIRKQMNNESGVILISSYGTMSTGVNIKRIHHIIFGSSYKSKIKVLQSIGRGLRTHESKKQLILWDIVDDLTWKIKKRDGSIDIGMNHVYKHFKERLKYYEQNNFKCFNRKIELEKL